MNKEKALILWFEAIGKQDTAIVGGKTASLGELTVKTAVPVPYGFATTANAYRYFMEKSGVNEKIAALLKTLTDVENNLLLRRISAQIRKEIIEAKMPEKLAEAIREAYNELGQKMKQPSPYVAVRSSATAEDLPDASFAGQQETYLNITGADAVIAMVKECYASTYTDRAVYYRTKQGYDHLAVALSAVIQMMVFSKAAGVMFTVNVATGDDSHIMIEGAWGLGEYIVQGTVTPDSYLIDKKTLAVDSKIIHEKKIKFVRMPSGGCEEKTVPADMVKTSVLTQQQLCELAKYALAIEKHYGCYMDIEWGIDERDDKIWILQARPETVWSNRKTTIPKVEKTIHNHNALVKGMPASPGIVTGKVRVINDPAKIDTFQTGEILVTEMTAPDWVPVMKKAKGIVTDAGGMTCHASIVSRELGIPCIVGTKSCGCAGTAAMKNDMIVTLDAAHGVVYAGDLSSEENKNGEKENPAYYVQESFPVTGTKIYMNLGDPDLAKKYGKLPCDGVGLMREEFIWTTYIHEHPLYMIAEGRAQEAVDKLAEGINKVCSAMAPRPVTLRFSDFKSSEYRSLKGGSNYEPHEPSALLGWRGASRYYDPKYIEAFKLEIKAVRKVREEYGLKNLHVMIPFCRSVEEARKVTEIMAAGGLRRSADFKIWLMAEIPANIILADQFNQFVDGYSIGSNDLTMLILGCDRDNDTISHIFDERNQAVKRAIQHLLQTAHQDGKTVSICGQAPSVYPDFTQFLIENGIDSISVNPDMVAQTKRNAAQIEQRIILNNALKMSKIK
ncbi:phosphoenolpyruvate synthase [Pectinatus cerevisiiphilus]|uniref:Phosphoenolpyruvate synthase n=1 Tax=Pectinatus cerevisiiphilus TaxID=86956 RepID=A0A4R3KEQ5_9FIRM|nr:phosphoenolpyruvate synthase [Pectinatus cerevisiiphilus]TCS81836.1 phosphoenolpyruvate synthase [Pectinatus cerevisiiphilus]